MSHDKRKFRVAEISKTWVDGGDYPGSQVRCVAEEFENVIDRLARDGYELVDWRLATTFGVVPVPAQVFGEGAGSRSNLVETVVAIFRRAGDHPAT